MTMTYSLLASLIVALTLVPAMASGMLKKEKAVKAGYDIHTSAQVLQQFYLRRYTEVTK